MSKTNSDHLHRTRSILKSCLLAGEGWNINIHNEQAISGPQTFGYICDQQTNWVWAFSSPRNEFLNATRRASMADKETVNAIRGELGFMVYQCSNGITPEPPAPDVNWELMLSSLIISYAGTTKVWSVADQMINGGHFIVMNYRKAGEKDSYLRPFIVPDTDNMQLPVSVLKSQMQTVYEYDQQNHPEWFA